MTPTRSDQGSQINGGMTDSDGIITGMDFTMTMETFSFTLPTLTAENGLGDSGTAATAGFPDTQVDESHDQGFAFLDYGDLPVVPASLVATTPLPCSRAAPFTSSFRTSNWEAR